jgi:hypothetical protein
MVPHAVQSDRAETNRDTEAETDNQQTCSIYLGRNSASGRQEKAYSFVVIDDILPRQSPISIQQLVDSVGDINGGGL